MNRRAILAIVRKDLKVAMQNRGVVLPIIILPLILFVVFPWVMVYASTLVSRGKGKAIVVSTGMDTEIGRIAGLARQVKEPRTPLQQMMAELSKFLVWFALGFSVLVPLIGIRIYGVLRPSSPTAFTVCDAPLCPSAGATVYVASASKRFVSTKSVVWATGALLRRYAQGPERSSPKSSLRVSHVIAACLATSD